MAATTQHACATVLEQTERNKNDGHVVHQEGKSRGPTFGPSWRRLWQHLTGSVRVDMYAEIELLLLTFCTGIQDATTFPDYHCFASNQTGNTVMLAIAIAGLGGKDLFIPANIGASLGLFLLGGWSIGQLGHVVGPRRRLWLVLSNTIQTAMTFAAAALQYRFGVQLEGPVTIGVIALLAYASGAQVVLSRAYSCNEISTAMATAAWVDLLVDPHLFSSDNRPRTRRFLFVVSLFLGAVSGAFMYVRMSSAFAILISGVGKAIVTVMLLFNKQEKREEKARGGLQVV